MERRQRVVVRCVEFEDVAVAVVDVRDGKIELAVGRSVEVARAIGDHRRERMNPIRAAKTVECCQGVVVRGVELEDGAVVVGAAGVSHSPKVVPKRLPEASAMTAAHGYLPSMPSKLWRTVSV